MTNQNDNNDKTSNENVHSKVSEVLKISTALGVTLVAACAVFTPRHTGDVIWAGLMGLLAASVGIYLVLFPEGRFREDRVPVRYLMWGVLAFVLNGVATIWAGQLVKRLTDYLEGQ